MIHVRHAAAAIASGLCETVLITRGESGRSGVGRTRNVVAPTSLAGQFELPYGPLQGRRLCLRSGVALHEYVWAHEQLAMVSVVQREWAAKNPRAAFKEPITIEDVLNSRTIPRTSCCGGAAFSCLFGLGAALQGCTSQPAQ
jgi:acetyl-CoA acetyltransferase